jgi:hypothetical protein
VTALALALSRGVSDAGAKREAEKRGIPVQRLTLRRLILRRTAVRYYALQFLQKTSRRAVLLLPARTAGASTSFEAFVGKRLA